MGLTGHILEVEVRMLKIRSPWIFQESRRVDDIDAYVDALKDAAARWPYTVGWVDCLRRGKGMGRGILMAGDWADPAVAPERYPRPLPRVTMPIELPGSAVGRLTVKAFNSAFYWRHLPREMRGIQHWESFFYPLDAVRHWNRIYGPRGFTQWQGVDSALSP